MENLEGELIIPYVMDLSLRSYTRRIENAMREIESHSRVSFEPMAYDDGHSLLIISGEGCYFSPFDCLGRRPRTCRPTVSIGEGCRSRGTMLHELMHAIGFEHEHQRPDRNRYLKINWGNIENGAKVQFKRIDEDAYVWDIDRFGFDYSSVMLYGEYDFSKNDRKTMQSKNGRTLMVQNQLSRMDKIKLNLL